MRCLAILILAFFSCLPGLKADRILADLDLSGGEWTLVGVPIHNYRMLPVQTELGTFICKDLRLMQDLQKSWDFDITFDDKCDYHYSLKFYHNGELVNTLNLNLYCNYLTVGGLSYQFSPEEFERIQQAARRVPWSRISFSDLEILKSAIRTLNKEEDVYWYEDVEQYKYPGYFMLSVNEVPWSSNRDSLKQEVQAKLEYELGSQDFYLQEYFHVIRQDLMYVRYMVNSDPKMAKRLAHRNVKWRSHLQGKGSVSILAIGVDEERYRDLMGHE